MQTNYATTSTQKIAPHPAYAAEDTPARVLERYIEDPANRERWASAEDVVAAMYGIVAGAIREDGKTKIPLRVPLGPDAWGMMKAECERIDRELEVIRPVSVGVGQKGQFESIDFLRG